jgi:hypothetical protein
MRNSTVKGGLFRYFTQRVLGLTELFPLVYPGFCEATQGITKKYVRYLKLLSDVAFEWTSNGIIPIFVSPFWVPASQC